MAASATLIAPVFPGRSNHHGTLFGGEALALMDKAAFLAASRHGRDTFVTASCDRIDFAAPAHVGELAEAVATVSKVGRTSVRVTVELYAEALLSGERRLCTRGLFVMVAPGRRDPLPPEPDASTGDLTASEEQATVFMDMVFPPATNHYGTLYGGDALSLMGRAAFVHATRLARGVMVMAASGRTDFTSPIQEGEMVELTASLERVGRSSLTIAVTLTAENLLTGDRREAARSSFVMVQVDKAGRPSALKLLPTR
jgi:acyl-CoA hydrolase